MLTHGVPPAFREASIYLYHEPSLGQSRVSEQDGSHTGEVVLCWALVEQARHEHMSDEY